jgi:hypothetical protein
VSLFDPHRLFTGLAPKILFNWTRGFSAYSAALILCAAALGYVNGQELLTPLPHTLNRQMLALG